MNCLCKCRMQWVYCTASAMCPCYLWQARSKNCQFKYSEILLLQGTHIWEPELLSLSFIVIAFSVTLYRLALHSLIPPLCCLVFASWLCSYLLPQYFNSDYVLFLSSAVFFPLSLFVSLALISSLWGSFGSESRFGARLRQYFMLIKRMVGSTVRAARKHFSS